MNTKTFTVSMIMLAAIQVAGAQVYISDPEVVVVDNPVGETEEEDIDEIVEPEYDDDEIAADSTAVDSMAVAPLPSYLFTPPVYLPSLMVDSASFEVNTRQLKQTEPELKRPETDLMDWIRREQRLNRMVSDTRRRHTLSHPEAVRYNLKDLPKAPEAVIVAVEDPSNLSVNIGNLSSVAEATVEQLEVTPQHWLNKLGLNLQFSQAYISPNWYQGGTSSLNLIADFTYSTKLNDKFHPKLLFENFFQWRTALTSTPDDQYHKYSITENRLQINSKFGYKASAKWYYTITGVFKTPVFNSFDNNNKMTASFLSPGELNLGIGMTYNTTNKSGSLKFNATVAPVSYNLKTVINKRIDEVSQGLEAGRKTKSSIGSNVDAVLEWKICYNVNWRSRLFYFTNYRYSQLDWQNQFQFTINRFLTANFNVDMRYDTSVQGAARDTSWHLLQLRELISLGFTYNITH